MKLKTLIHNSFFNLLVMVNRNMMMVYGHFILAVVTDIIDLHWSEMSSYKARRSTVFAGIIQYTSSNLRGNSYKNTEIWLPSTSRVSIR